MQLSLKNLNLQIKIHEYSLWINNQSSFIQRSVQLQVNRIIEIARVNTWTRSWCRNSSRSEFALELFVLRSRRLRVECNPQMSSSCRGKLPSCLAFNLPLVASLGGTTNGRNTAGRDFRIRQCSGPSRNTYIPWPRLKTGKRVSGFTVLVQFYNSLVWRWTRDASNDFKHGRKVSGRYGRCS